jgi:hypothetical protein
MTQKKPKVKKNKTEFSKILLIQESILVWITTLAFLALAFKSINLGYFGDLAWLTVLCGSIWTAYGVSQACYYQKSKAENTEGGIKYKLASNSSTHIYE